MHTSRPYGSRSNGVSRFPRRPAGTARSRISRIETELSVARPLATLQLWSGMVTRDLRLDWRPAGRARQTDTDRTWDVGAAAAEPSRPLEPGVPYPWPWPQTVREPTQTQLVVELMR